MQPGEGAASVLPRGEGPPQALDEHQQHAQVPPPVRIHPPAAAPSAASNSGATLAAGGAAGNAIGAPLDATDGDGWMSGPFRLAPMGYVMHSTPSGTPLASPRTGPTTPEQERRGPGDLEAPLLAGLKPRAQRHQQQFESGGVVKAVVFGLINTAAGVVGWGGCMRLVDRPGTWGGHE